MRSKETETTETTDTTETTETTETEAKGEFTLLLFASASTYTGGQETLWLPAPTTLRGVFRTLETRYPGILEKVLLSSAVTVNLDYVDLDVGDFEVDDDDDDDDILKRDEKGDGRGPGPRHGQGLDMVINVGDEVGIIPPVSSG